MVFRLVYVYMFHNRAGLCVCFCSNTAPRLNVGPASDERSREWNSRQVKGSTAAFFSRQILVQWIMRLEWSWWRQVHWCLLVGSWCWRTWTKAGLVEGTVNEREGMVKMGWYAGGWRVHGIFGWYLRRGIGLNSSPHMEKMGSPQHLAWIYGRHHGLTPNRLLSVFYVLCVCIWPLSRWKRVISPQEDQSWTPSHQSTLSSGCFFFGFEQVYKSNSWRKSWLKNRNPLLLKSGVGESPTLFCPPPFKFHLVTVRDYFSVTLNKLLICYHLFLVGSTTF